jgi:hypothetical protein
MRAMKYEEQTNQSAENQLEGSFAWHHLLDRLSFIVGIALTPIFPVLLYSFTTNSLPNILTVEAWHISWPASRCLK